MDNKIVVYTAIFGTCDGLLPQKPQKGIDYVCFSDRIRKASPWKVRVVDAYSEDPVRSAKIFKILPHRYFPDHEWSIWIDGNYLINGEVAKLISTLPTSPAMACFDHRNTAEDARGCIYKEYEAILELGQSTGRFKDDPALMKQQTERYEREGFPHNQGLISGGVLCRRHHDPKNIACMEMWWKEICGGSRRDQLSFNYVAWKLGFSPYYLPGNIRNNAWFYQIGIHRSDYRAKLFRYRLRRLFGLIKH